MQEKLLKIRVPESTFKALDYFVKLKGSTLDVELGKAVDMLYEKFVPKEVRSYVEGTQPEADDVNGKLVRRKRSDDAGDGSPV